MGEEGPVRQRTLRAYMDLYDFTNLSILASLRLVCARLVLRAETQQVDRILVAFASRWCACNPNHGFKSTDIIHTICYSIMLLNTDLHMADIEHKMTRSQFVKNTMTTIKQTLEESAPEAFERPSILPGRGRNLGVAPDSDPSVRPSSEQGPSDSLAPSTRQPPRPESSLGAAPTSTTAAADGEAVPPLVQAPFDGPLRFRPRRAACPSWACCDARRAS
ncbi:hypothetical protein VTK73DRAFT_5850 [Phialemonium thermophilum]|uniref:SEC7 domain-containing protein n=1 Tax=Phialemonium thermophilum TaxID=223376 RepID=A0ABR3V0I1_9PEZI